MNKSRKSRKSGKTARIGGGKRGAGFGAIFLLLGAILLAIGLISPSYAQSTMATLASVSTPKIHVEFMSNGVLIHYVQAYDYVNNILYETRDGSLDLPEGSYLVKAPGFKPVVVHLYGMAHPIALNLEPVEEAHALADILELIHLGKMSTVLDMPKWAEDWMLSQKVDPHSYCSFDPWSQDAKNDVIASAFRRTERERFKWSRIPHSNIEYTYNVGTTCSPSGCITKQRVVLKIGNVYCGTTPERLQQLIAAYQTAYQEIQAEKQSIMMKQKEYQKQTIIVKAFKGGLLRVKGGFDTPTTHLTKLVRLEEIGGVKVDLTLLWWKRHPKPDVVKRDYSVTTPGKIFYDWPVGYSGEQSALIVKKVEKPGFKYNYLKLFPEVGETEIPRSIARAAGLPEKLRHGYKIPLILLKGEKTPYPKRGWELSLYLWPEGESYERYLVAEAEIRGQLLDKETGNPIPEAFVHVETEVVVYEGDKPKSKPKIIVAKTDSNGEFTFTLRIPRDGRRYPFTLFPGKESFGATYHLGRYQFFVTCDDRGCKVDPPYLKIYVDGGNPALYDLPLIGHRMKEKGAFQGVDEEKFPVMGAPKKEDVEQRLEAAKKAWLFIYENYDDPEKKAWALEALKDLNEVAKKKIGRQVISPETLKEMEEEVRQMGVQETHLPENMTAAKVVEELSISKQPIDAVDVKEPDGSVDTVFANQPVQMESDIEPPKTQPTSPLNLFTILGALFSSLGALGMAAKW